jgi:uncharacterized protein (TIRG00374 family)
MKFKSRYLGIIGIVILIYILLQIDLPRVFTILKSVDLLFLIIAVLVNPVVIVIMTLRWKYIVHIMGVDEKFRLYLVWILKGTFLGAITPGKIGDFYRANYLSKQTNLELVKSFSSVIIDKILDVFGLIVLNIIGIFMILYIYEVNLSWTVPVLLSFIILFGMLILLKKNLMRKLLKPAYKLFVPTTAKQKVVMHFNEFYGGLSRMKFNNYLIGFTLTIAGWITTFFGIYFLALSLHISVSLIFIISMAPIASFLSVLPISVGGLGTREAVYVFFLSSLSIESEYSVALALMVFIFLYLVYVPVGIVTYLLFNDKP